MKGLIDKAKGRINEAGGTKDNIRDELGEADRERTARRPPRGSGTAWLQEVKDYVQDEWAESQEHR